MAKEVKGKINRREAEKLLEDKFKGNNCSFTYPGYPTVYGMVDSIGIETEKGEKNVIIVMNNKRYSVSIECLHECLKLL
jgi:hypothetical protein